MSPHLLSGAARLAGSSLLRLQSDERLIALIRDGHDPAFTAVVDRYRPELLRYCTRLVGEARAEDVVQQAFLNAHNAMTSNETDIQLRPWLYRIAHNAGLNVLRSSRPQVELDERLAAAGGVEEEFENRDRLQHALVAIAALPEPQRDALTLRAVEGRSHVEIASALGVTPGAARQQVHRARTTVRAAVSAVTPYGLIARFAMAGAGEPATAQLLSGAGTSAGIGVGATVAKVAAGVLAAGAIVTGTGNLPFVHHHRSRADAPKAARTSEAGRSARAVPAAATEVAATRVGVVHSTRAAATPVASHNGRSGSGTSGSSGSGSSGSGSGSSKPNTPNGRGDDSGHSGSGSSGSGHSGDGSGSGDSSHSGSGSSGGGSDDSGSGSSGSGSSGSGLSGDGSGSGDSSHSGSGSSGDGSDDSGSGSSGSGLSGDGTVIPPATTTTPTTTTPTTTSSGSGSGHGGDNSDDTPESGN